MNTSEKLQELIRHHAVMAENLREAANRARMLPGRGLHVAADDHEGWVKLLAEQSNPGWIAISTRMPVEGERVLLVWVSQSIPAMRIGAWWGVRRGWLNECFGAFTLHPTHWMRFPSVPEKVEVKS